jgi:uncharacterized delta-60 repeat protein
MKTNKMSDDRISRVLKQALSLAVLLSLTAGILVFTPKKAEAAASQFDMTFGTAGKVVTDFGGFDRLLDLATQDDGKIVAVGFTDAGNDFAVARYNSNGSLDPTFDGDGMVTTDLSGFDEARAVAIQADGKIVAAGTCGSNICLARYNSNGTLDPAFDLDGRVITDLPNLQSVNDIAIQPDGKIVVVGKSFSGPGTDDFIVARYDPNGTLDTNFNTNGYVITTLPGTDQANAVALQSDGKIIAVGQSDQDFSLFRYNSNGSLDPSFDTDGIVTTNIAGTDIANDVIIQPDGKIIAAGRGEGDFALARYNANGSLDPNFDADGKVVVDLGDFDDCRAAALQPDGKIVAVGKVENRGMAVARFNPTGALDTSFHGDGKLTTVITSSGDIANAVAIQNDGKIVIGGSPNGGTVNFALARFLGDPRAVVTNNTGIVLEDRNGTNPPFLNTSTVNVSGLPGAITKVRVSLNKITHTFPADLDIILESPTGVRTMLMSDTGGGSGQGFVNKTIIIDQSAANTIPVPTTGNFGFFKPTNLAGETTLEPGGIDVFPAPGPGSQNYGVGNLDVFNGTRPNGTWKLYAVDDEAQDFGGFDGWTLDVTTTVSGLNNLGADFDGDGKTDISIFRPSDGSWWVNRSSSSITVVAQFGQSTDIIAPGDFTGDGKTDVAFFRPSTGFWFILRSEDNSFFSFPFGATGDIPAPADYDGDGRADSAVFRPADSTWYIRRSSDLGTTIVSFGTTGDKPVTADYDGDGLSDIAIFRPSDGSWWYLRSSDGQFSVYRFGVSTDKPVPADYTGDGRADIAVWRPSTGFWFIQRSEDNSFFSFPFGTSGDLPAPGDYDGNGIADASVFRPSAVTWFSLTQTQGTIFTTFGAIGDKPVPAAFVP